MNKLAFLFPGQGSQYVGIGKALYDSYPIARRTFEEASGVLRFDLAQLCFEGPIDELTLTANAQPAVLTVSVAAFRVIIQQSGVVPFVLAGHSLGEITALACAEAISFPDAVSLVRQRGLFMQEAVGPGSGSMAAVSGVTEQTVRRLCDEVSNLGLSVVISNYNTPEQIVISGHAVGVQEAEIRLKRAGAVVIPLKVSAPFHSPLMQPAADKFRQELNRCAFQSMKWPVISNVTAKPYQSYEEIAETLSAQITQPVRWTESMNHVVELGVDTVLDLGPQSILRGMMRRFAPDVKAFAYDNKESLQEWNAFLAGLSGRDTERPSLNVKNRKGESTLLSRCLAVAVCTKNRSRDSGEYERGVVMPYREIMRIHSELEEKGEKPTSEHERLALDMLGSVFAAKLTPLTEQEERYRQILKEMDKVQAWNGYVSELLNKEGRIGIGNL